MKTVTKIIGGVLFSGALVSASAAFAQEAPANLAPVAASNSSEVLSTDDLENLSGGTGVTVNVLTTGTLTAVNSGNTVSGDVVGSGNVNVGSNAFSGFTGVGNFVFNTGHNNNLQANMSVSVVLAPPEAAAQ